MNICAYFFYFIFKTLLENSKHWNFCRSMHVNFFYRLCTNHFKVHLTLWVSAVYGMQTQEKNYAVSSASSWKKMRKKKKKTATTTTSAIWKLQILRQPFDAVSKQSKLHANKPNENLNKKNESKSRYDAKRNIYSNNDSPSFTCWIINRHKQKEKETEKKHQLEKYGKCQKELSWAGTVILSWAAEMTVFASLLFS